MTQEKSQGRRVARLQLELRRVRSRATAARLEATVARLEARAAELQWLIERAGGPAAPALPPKPAKPDDQSPPHPHTSPTPCPPTATGIRNWEQLAAAVRQRRSQATDAASADNSPDQTPACPSPAPAANAPADNTPAANTPADNTSAKHVSAGRRKRPQARIRRIPAPPRPAKKRRAAWIVSMAIHAGLLLALGGLTLSVHRPQDQLALTATAAAPNALDPLQTLHIESALTPQEVDSSQPAERPLEIDPVGAVPLPPPSNLPALPTEVSAPPGASLSPLLDDQDMLAALSAETHRTTRFCGVEGGGNHFVYIVDSSQSMKNGRFESARRELLQAIDALQPQQRFYIMFYDIHLDRMRVTDPNQADPYAVLASDENKRRARRWAMSVKLEQGAPPEEALRFALQLRPDVIFLLSDGEFPQRIEDLMAEQNRTSNLFGDAGPISILHTIGYHSRDGETRMRRLATANGGQYRYIPPPVR